MINLDAWQARARQLKREIYALYFAYQDPRTPWYAKALALVVVGYAFSPIDLIPDPIPLLGYLDDLILLPLGIALLLKLIPPTVMEDCRVKAQAALAEQKPTNWVAAVVIILLWLTVAGALGLWLWRWFLRNPIL